MRKKELYNFIDSKSSRYARRKDVGGVKMRCKGTLVRCKDCIEFISVVPLYNTVTDLNQTDDD